MGGCASVFEEDVPPASDISTQSPPLSHTWSSDVWQASGDVTRPNSMTITHTGSKTSIHVPPAPSPILSPLTRSMSGGQAKRMNVQPAKMKAKMSFAEPEDRTDKNYNNVDQKAFLEQLRLASPANSMIQISVIEPTNPHYGLPSLLEITRPSSHRVRAF